MKQSCWSCKHCINDYFATGTMDCKKQDDMTEDELNNEKLNNDGENAEVRIMVSIIIHRGRWVKAFMLLLVDK